MSGSRYMYIARSSPSSRISSTPSTMYGSKAQGVGTGTTPSSYKRTSADTSPSEVSDGSSGTSFVTNAATYKKQQHGNQTIQSARDKPIVTQGDQEESGGKWKHRYLKMEELYESAQRKIKQLERDLDQSLAQEKNKETLDRLKAKFSVLENSIMLKHKQEYADLEKENKKLATEISKLQVEVDRIKDQDHIIANYRLAIAKMKNQITTLKLALDQHYNEKVALKSELEAMKNVNQELQQNVDTISRQLQEAEQYKKTVENTRKKLVNEEVAKLQSQVTTLEGTVAHQKEIIEGLQNTVNRQRADYNLQLQTALELASEETPNLPIFRPKEPSHPVIGASSTSANDLSTDRKNFGTHFKKDLATLDEEIEELQNDLERAVAKFEMSKRLE